MSAGLSDTPDGSLARAAFDLAQADPARAVELAGPAIRDARRRADPLDLSVAQQALGLALRSLEQPRESTVALRRAVRTAEDAGLTHQAGQSRMSLAVSLLYLGRHGQSLRQLDLAAAELTGIELAQLDVQRGIVLWLLGRPAAAAERVPAALSRLRAAGESRWEARGLNVLGLTGVELGRYGEADDAFRRAEQQFAALGQLADAAGNRHNRGWCAGLLGDIPAALRHLEEAERQFAALHLPLVELRLDRARLLLDAGLAREALVTADRLAAELSARGERSAYADALLVAAEAALAAGDHVRAATLARQAAGLYDRQHRTGKLALATHLAVRARWAAGERGRRLLRAASAVADDLRAEGLLAPAGQALLLAGRLARELGDGPEARDLLGRVARGRHRGPASGRSQAWYAEAMLRLDRGDRRGAFAALGAGFRVLDAYGAGLGALELRAHVSSYAADLVAAGRTLAVGTGRAEQVLRWSELGRGLALRLPRVRPPDDPELATALAGLRRLAAQPDSAARRRQEEELRDRVRRRALRVEGRSGERPWSLPDAAGLERALGGAALVSLVVVGGTVHAVVVAGRRRVLRAVGPAAPVDWEAGFLGMWTRRALQPGSATRGATALAEALRSAERLDGLLFGPLADLIGDRDLVVVPPAPLAVLPWSLLPVAADRTVSLAPSLASWYAATVRPARPGPTVLVAGPDLEHAEAEVRALAAGAPNAIVLTGVDAGSAAVLAAMDGAGIAHLAAHGDVRADSPLFSALRLADGPLMAYDLGRLDRPPELVVLSACDSAAAGGPGEELLGLPVAMLHSGVRTVIASVAKVPDAVAPEVMTRLHAAMADGAPPQHALARTVRELRDAPPLLRAAAAAFVAVGGTPA
ncbi:MAG TPA: CHAT domain-containing protein [Mycobacteriales bacterium]|nr:CHAT domain-containing protein [Mycobacteriales bacterium]